MGLAAAGVLAGCSSPGDGGGGDPAAETYTVWDPYAQYGAGSEWGKLLERCGAGAGVAVARTGLETTDLTNRTMLAAQQGQAPDVLVVDNPMVSTLAAAGILTTTEQIGVATTGIEPNLLAAGQLGGRTYGVPIGANTLALYYNKAVLDQAGVDPGAVRDWASLTAALEKVRASGKRGITFSAAGTEEGSFQFLPWFWGAGARLTKLDSQRGVAAAALWTAWVRRGYAPGSVLSNTQTASWREFATGGFGFGENGTWQLADARRLGFEYGTIPIPAQAGGIAPGPIGGEFVTVPVQGDTARYAVSRQLVTCLTGPGHADVTDATLSYVSASAAGQARQAAAQPELRVWVDAVRAAKSRTGGSLGTNYPKISEPMWGAVQASLSRAKSPRAAMTEAQAAAAAAIR
ncbi:sugar ABC transporter substrate-binding protein [Nonomuraea zeae]|uniref:sugar ABC transporter substrate-binding protein n=1 Tax=Nonomuraea zeae TaxID=1642303 RepID=UPI00197D16ED|nr:extracellular solute-binding protein [Nonomuraea zeae]